MLLNPPRCSPLMLALAVFIAALTARAVSVSAGDYPHPTPRLSRTTLFQVVGSMYRIDPDLLNAIAAVESRGNSTAVSPAGAQGLMQLMPATARRFHVGDPLDPVDNVLGAARYLDYLRRSQSSNSGPGVSLARWLAAYNSGERSVAKYGGVPPYNETQHYVRLVLIAYLLESLISHPEVPASHLFSTLSPMPIANLPGAPAAGTVVIQKLQRRDAMTESIDPLEQLARIKRERTQRLAVASFERAVTGR